MRLQDPWWQKTAAKKHMSDTSKYIMAAARERRWESGRHGRGGGDSDAAES